MDQIKDDTVQSPVKRVIKQFYNQESEKNIIPSSCYICSKLVYKVEQVIAVSHIWHKQCFTCGGIGKIKGNSNI